MTRIEHIGDATLYLGNMADILPTLDLVDLVLTDPPYDEKTHNGARMADAINFSSLQDPASLSKQLIAQSRGWVLAFCAFEQLADYKNGADGCWIRGGIWDKIINMPQMTGDRPAQGGEAIAIMHRPGRKIWNGGGKAAIWRHSVERGEKEHPTQKPLSLIRELLEQFSQPGHTVLDCYMGGGTTGVACAKLGRKFIGVEIDETHFETACRRIAKAYSQPDFFVAPPEPKPTQGVLIP